MPINFSCANSKPLEYFIFKSYLIFIFFCICGSMLAFSARGTWARFHPGEGFALFCRPTEDRCKETKSNIELRGTPARDMKRVLYYLSFRPCTSVSSILIMLNPRSIFR